MGTEGKITLSVIKADVGGWVGHSTCYPEMLALARKIINQAEERGIRVDGQVLTVGDEKIEMIFIREFGTENPRIHRLAWDTFMELTALAKSLKLCRAERNIRGSKLSANVNSMDPIIIGLIFEGGLGKPLIKGNSKKMGTDLVGWLIKTLIHWLTG